jgi:GNAT superfamily N-acetyltransferase
VTAAGPGSAGADAAFLVRPATEDDLFGAFSVWWANDHPDQPVPRDESGWHSLEHELRTGRLSVAVATADGSLIGVAGSIERAGVSMLGDLFVHPDWHGRGVGTALLDDVFPAGAWPRQTFSSSHPNALPVYVRAGMVPRWTLLYVRGNPSTLPDELRPPPDVVTEAAEPRALAELDKAWTGVRRPEDHEYAASFDRAMVLVVHRGAEPIAFGYVGHAPITPPERLFVGPIMATTAADAAVGVGAILDAVASAGVASVEIPIPGPHPALVPLIRAGFRIADRDLYVASEDGLIDPDRRVPDPSFA